MRGTEDGPVRSRRVLLAFIGVQLFLPSFALVARLLTERCYYPFGWQMYSCLP